MLFCFTTIALIALRASERHIQLFFSPTFRVPQHSILLGYICVMGGCGMVPGVYGVGRG